MNLQIFLSYVLYASLFFPRRTKCFLKYKIRVSNFCNKTQMGMFRSTSLSLRDCVYGCSVRYACEGLEYYRKHTLCVLLAQTINLDHGDGEALEPCTVVERQSIEAPTTCSCRDNRVCEGTDDGQTCVIKDCEPIKEVSNGRIHGNMHDLGSKLTYSCSTNYINNNDDVTVTCLHIGQWDKQAICIVLCEEPSIGENVQLSPGNTTGGSIRTYTCHTGFYYGVGEVYVTSVTTECLQETGTWSLNVVNCVEGSHVLGKCSAPTPCVDAHTLCLESICFCHAMFKYDPDAGRCVERCTSIKDDFELIDKIRFYGFNDWRVNTDDVDECKAECITNPECFHVEDWTSNADPHCNLGRASFQAVSETTPANIRTGNRIYTRKCT